MKDGGDHNRYRTRLSVPGPRIVLSTEAEARASYVRRAVHLIQSGIEGQEALPAIQDSVFGPRWANGSIHPAGEPVSLGSAWAIVSMWLIVRLTNVNGGANTLLESERAFFGQDTSALPSLAALVSVQVEEQARQLLECVTYDQDFKDLLPYILDAHGPGSRMSVKRDPSTQRARAAKRQAGVFYTPTDVAEYIALGAMAECDLPLRSIRCLDPACGSGVFLKAVLTLAGQAISKLDRLAFVQQHLFGFDVSRTALEAATFMLLHECQDDVRRRGLSLWRAWHSIRLNLAVVDALTVSSPDGSDQGVRDRVLVRESIMDDASWPECVFPESTLADPQWGLFEEPGLNLGTIFPELRNGVEIVLGNPPYTRLGQRDDSGRLRAHFVSFGGDVPSSGDALYPLFIEMMWRLTAPEISGAGFVVPLSIAYHRGRQFRTCRRAIMQSGGRWRFAFFDREPHALFGEDVKTRNAILFRKGSSELPPRDSLAFVETGPLRRWTSRTRERLFQSITFTPLKRRDIGIGIPKVCGVEQAHALAILDNHHERLESTWIRAFTCSPAEAFSESESPRVYVAGTAYNFLNVFRAHDTPLPVRTRLTQNPLFAMEFSCESDAWSVLAVLTSRLVYWLWHVRADGFHVPRWFLADLPIGKHRSHRTQWAQLSKLGMHMWKAVQRHQILSVNGGRQSVAYKPYACERELDAIDGVLLKTLGIDKSFGDALKLFVRSTVTVDESDSRRQHFLTQFETSKVNA